MILCDIYLYNVPACDITAFMLLKRDSGVLVQKEQIKATRPVIDYVANLQFIICKLSITL